MKKGYLLIILTSVLALAACQKDVRPGDTAESKKTDTQKVTTKTVKNEPVIGESQGETLAFDNHEYTYEVVSGATQTTFGTTPPALYTKEEKADKMFWSNQPPLGLLEGDYYKNEGSFTGGNYGIVEVVMDPKEQQILDVAFTEFASEPYYDQRYSGVNKRLSDYAFFQAANTRTDETLVTVVNGITYVEQQMRSENRLTGDFLTVKGSSTSARDGFMPLAADLSANLKEPSASKYFGYAEELPNGLIGRLEVVLTDQKISEVSYDEYFADSQDKMTDATLKPYFRQSKYYSLTYNEATNNQFQEFADQLVKEIKSGQSLDLKNSELEKHESYNVYQKLASQLDLTKTW